MSEFCGHHTSILDNGFLRLEYITDVGPRIARLFPKGSDSNLLAEVPDLGTNTPYGRFSFMGGHRLWLSPEVLPRTYVPDQPLTIETLADGVRLCASTEPGTGIAKTIEIHAAADRAALTIRHEIRNNSLWTIELSPWALTMFRMGGVAILPQPVEDLDPARLMPNRRLILWPYTNIQDSRLRLDNDFILFKADAFSPCKIGYHNLHGWAGYWLDHMLFIKRYAAYAHAALPDEGCNTEVYCNERFIELETLGSLKKIAPGEIIVHEEHWELYDSLSQPFISDSLSERVLGM